VIFVNFFHWFKWFIFIVLINTYDPCYHWLDPHHHERRDSANHHHDGSILLVTFPHRSPLFGKLFAYLGMCIWCNRVSNLSVILLRDQLCWISIIRHAHDKRANEFDESITDRLFMIGLPFMNF
jgi:hypothetical protein